MQLSLLESLRYLGDLSIMLTVATLVATAFLDLVVAVDACSRAYSVWWAFMISGNPIIRCGAITR